MINYHRGHKNVKGAAAPKGPITYAKALENYGESYGVRGCKWVAIGQIDSLKAGFEVLRLRFEVRIR